MKDQQSIALLAELHPAVRPKFQGFIDEVEETYPEVVMRLIQVYRSFEEQARTYAQGRTAPGQVVTNARPGSSYHVYRLAVDTAPLKAGRIDYGYNQAPFALIAAKYGIDWGGNWHSIKDYDHYECRLGHDEHWWKELLPILQAKKYIPGTNFIELPA